MEGFYASNMGQKVKLLHYLWRFGGHLGIKYVVCLSYSLSLSLPLFALRSEKTRRFSKDASK